MKLILTYLIIVVCLVSNTVQAQDKKLCKEKLIHSFEKLIEYNTDSLQKWNIQYAVKNVYESSSHNTSTEYIKIVKNHRQTIFTTEASTCYMDDKDMFMIMSAQKKIYRMDPRVGQSANSNQFSTLQKMLLDSSSVTACQTLTDSTARIQIIPPMSMKETYFVEHVDYIINTKKETIKSCTLHYKKGQVFKYTSYEIKELSHQPVTQAARPVYEEFLSAGTGTKLHSRWSGYELIDLRGR